MNHIGKNTFYNILAQAEDDTEATILIYNYIGEWWSWDPEAGYKQTGTTDIQFVNDLDELAKKYPVINVRINCLGGEIFHGAAIVNAIKNCKAEIHTWNDGVAASMAAIIWMSGKQRHMAKNAMLMLHSASMICWGNARDMREMADTLDQFDSSLVISAADSVGAKEDEIRAAYFDGKDHWLTYNDVEALGWSSKDDDFTSGNPLPTNKALNYRELLAAYEQKVLEGHSKPPKPDTTEQPGIVAQFKAWFDEAKSVLAGTNPPSSPSPSTEDMNISDFKASLADGTLNLTEVHAHLESLSTPASSAATGEPGGDDDEESAVIKDLRAQLAAQATNMTSIEAKITALGAQPGAGKSTPGMPDADLPSADGALSIKARYEKANADMAAAAASGEPARFIPGE
jgi:ATP-dependent protease ClpP protease subunit